MKTLFCSLSFIAFSVVAATDAYPFWDQSHQLVGEIASRKITIDTAKEVEKLLNVKIGYPGSESLAKNTNSMDTAASWADSIKSYDDQSINSRLSLCHFSDIPLTKEMVGKEVDVDLALSNLNKLIAKVPDNSVTCLKSAIKTLLVSSENELNKAIALRMIIHLVGDIGQPLHNADFTEGDFDDAGGNKIKLKQSVSIANIDGTFAGQNNLHKIWDASLGVYLQFSFSSEDSRQGIFTQEEKKYTKNIASDILKNSNFNKFSDALSSDPNEQSVENWVLDSYKIAAKKVYTDLSLKKPEKHMMTVSFSDSWKSYQADRVDTIDIQIKKSATRLFGLLNSIYDSNSPKNQYSILVSSISNNDDIRPLLLK